MSRKKLEYFGIEDEIYGKTFHLFVNVPRKKFKNWLIKSHKQKMTRSVKNALISAKAMCIWDYHPFYYLWIEKFDWSIEHQCVLVHEISHHVDWVLSGAGIALNWNNSEVRAYYLEYLMRKCYTELKALY